MSGVSAADEAELQMRGSLLYGGPHPTQVPLLASGVL